MKLVSFCCDKGFNLLLHFHVFIEPHTQKALASYQLETLLAAIKDNNTEANSYTWAQPRKDCLAMSDEKFIFD